MTKRSSFPYAAFNVVKGTKAVKSFSGTQVGMDAAYEYLEKHSKAGELAIQRIYKTETKEKTHDSKGVQDNEGKGTS